jgi:hypothetical protein
MSCSTLGTTYTSVSGRTIISGGSANTIGGGRGITTRGGGGGTMITRSACTKQGIESATTITKIIVLKLNFFIFLPPLLGLDSFFCCLLLSYYRVENIFPPR